MTVHSQQAFSHSKRADKAGGPDPAKLNIYILTRVHRPVQGAINKSELLWYGEIVERLRKPMMAVSMAEESMEWFCSPNYTESTSVWDFITSQASKSLIPVYPPPPSGFWEHSFNE